MALALKQIPRLVEQNREPKNKPMHMFSIYDKGAENNNRKRCSGR